MTEKLYYEDSFKKEFTATVLECDKIGEKYGAVLDKTAFFPEGGGQKGDRGKLNDIAVLETIILNNKIYHITDAPLSVGETVIGRIDWETRFSRMQNHTGEHIVSGVLHSLYGIDNVGFALYDGYFTFDTSKPLTKEMVRTAERLANEAVFACAEVKTYFPTSQELKHLEYRSKKEIEGQIRIVEVVGFDRTACCAPMVKNSGQIGLIKLLSFMNFKGGSRVFAVCGKYALEDYTNKQASVAGVSAALCAPQNEILSATEQLIAKKESLEYEIKALKQKLCYESVVTAPKNKDYITVFGDYDTEQQRYIANQLSDGCRAVLVLSGNDTDGYSFTLKTAEEKLDELVKLMRENLNCRGGGRAGFAQGRINNPKDRIEEIFLKCAENVYADK